MIRKTALAGVCILAVALIPNWEHQIQNLNKLQVLGKTVKFSDVRSAPELALIVDKPETSAKSILAYDYTSGSFLYTANFDERLPIASLTKLTTALVVADSGKLNDIIEITEEDTKVIGPNTGLVPYEKIRASELLKAMLISSHNDSTQVLARHVGGTIENFVKLMNEKAIKLGLQNTHYVNPVGFDDDYHYSNALDISKVIQEFSKNDQFNTIVKTKETEISSVDNFFKHKIITTNKLLLEDENVIGVKTGFTSQAKGNLAIRSKKDRADVVTIVLGSDDREGDTRKILDWISTVYRW